jgi:hypothetical protein
MEKTRGMSGDKHASRSKLLADALARRRRSRARSSFRWASRPMKPLVNLADKGTVYAMLDADRQ